MSSASFLIKPDTEIVIDASVAININATQYGARILTALPHRCLITSNVYAELERGKKNGHNDHLIAQELLERGFLHLNQLGNKGADTYLRLIDGSAKITLDDGEAATIALAEELSGIAVIDEKKARIICADIFPHLEILSTADLLVSQPVIDLLGIDACADALMNAFVGARMRVTTEKIGIVTELLGPERLKLCTSLPKSARENPIILS